MMSSWTDSMIPRNVGQFRKHVIGEEFCGRGFSLVEGLAVGRRGRQRGVGDIGVSQQPPTDEQVANREQKSHRCEPDFIYFRWLLRGGLGVVLRYAKQLGAWP